MCNPGSGDLCDPDEVCSGTADQACPSDTVAPSSTVCRAAAGVCDAAENCTGTADAACPADLKAPSGTECRADAGQCDVAESCDGISDACPADGFEPNGTPCNDLNLCTVGEVCTAGVCGGGTATSCLDHYKCYKAKDLKQPKFAKTTVTLSDQLFAGQSTDVKKPYLVCNPADKNNEGISDPSAHLACYKVKGPKIVTPPKVKATNQFGTVDLALKKTSLLCVPSAKTIVP